MIEEKPAQSDEALAASDMAKRYANVYLETSSVMFFRFLGMAVSELPLETIRFGSAGRLVESQVELLEPRLPIAPTISPLPRHSLTRTSFRMAIPKIPWRSSPSVQ